ncbi:MAG TPA: wax ester/triacylglycerol synthase family O-acyltransferase [Streptosporangiaceae bacterium]|nr:wax ester/triacylglycerol synthase family O-acyltransferase [Streptosporangiaceae bacterium]
MERLKPMDAQFIDAEDQDAHASFAIASIAIFEGPPPSYDDFLSAVAGRLPDIPIYRRKLRTVPLRLGPPVWVDDPEFDLRYHVRQTALPPPGGDSELQALVARVMGQRLDRDYPLWEFWLVQGLSGGRWALVSKVHHAMIDGVAGIDLYRLMFDATPETAASAAGTCNAGEQPSALTLAVQAAAEMMLLPAKTVLALAAAAARPERSIRQLRRTARATARLAAAAWPAASSSLSGPIGRQRRYAWSRASLTDVKEIKRALGGTVNDVVLAAISSGFRALLVHRGEDPKPHMVPSLIPVSMRAPGEQSILDNRVSVLVADLPVHIADPVEQLEFIKAEMSELKAVREATAAEALITLGRFTPYPIASRVVRLGYRLPQHEIVTVTTNVPGPGVPSYAMGRRLLEMIPYVPIATTLRTGVSIFSYCDQLTFGITADYASTPDIDVLVRGIEVGVRELQQAALR